MSTTHLFARKKPLQLFFGIGQSTLQAFALRHPAKNSVHMNPRQRRSGIGCLLRNQALDLRSCGAERVRSVAQLGIDERDRLTIFGSLPVDPANDLVPALARHPNPALSGL